VYLLGLAQQGGARWRTQNAKPVLYDYAAV